MKVTIEKELFFELLKSHMLLGKEEYNRNPAYNDTHYHYQCEKKLWSWLADNDLIQEFTDYINNVKSKE